MRIQDKIRILRKARGLSQTEFGYLIHTDGVSRQAVSNWENGVYEPSLDNVKDIAAALNVSIAALMDDTVDLSNPSILQAVLNNDYKEDTKHSNVTYIKVYRSYRILMFALGILVSFAFLMLFQKGNEMMNELQISDIEAPGEAQNIMSGVNDLKEYVIQIGERDKELEENIQTLFQYMIRVSITLFITFLATFVIVFINPKRSVATLSNHNLLIYNYKKHYITFEDIVSIEKSFFGLTVKTKEKSYSLFFVSNRDEIISFYNQLKILSTKM